MPSGSLAGTSCLVLGAGGFIGLHLCQALVAAGARVHGYGRAPAFPEAMPPLRWTSGEFDDTEALAEALRGAEVVFNLLGGSIPALANRDPQADLSSNLVASVRLLELCGEAEVRKFVFISSGGTVYGVPRVIPIPETHPTDPISAYGIHKLMVEKYVGLHAQLNGLRSVVLRAANPFGPYQSPHRGQGIVAALIATRLAGRPVRIWGDGRVVRDFLYVGDLAEAMLDAALYEGPEQVLNLGSGVGRSMLDVVAAVDATLGGTGEIIFQPGRNADVPVNVLDNTLIRREFGWKPRMEWEAGLRLTADWIAATYFPAR
ncbi:UDP-glucose 4-epimerase [Humitalea rosea]|uniref:UDP-glucose 4-epimerase n=1 Tax=Humitalea rosea TaxID=990373 RepID=A0A2W7J9F8_9PROT|nr:NAD-dependent epimerase/dehydratase family protein [Humitalea rosea]PZW48632.1 UDP-glucose 4-epimerase [Humitalea rosea]